MRLERRDRSKRGFYLSGLGDKPDLCCELPPNPGQYIWFQILLCDISEESLPASSNRDPPHQWLRHWWVEGDGNFSLFVKKACWGQNRADMVAPQSSGTQTAIIHSTFLMLPSILRVTSQPTAITEALAVMSVFQRGSWKKGRKSKKGIYKTS